MSGNPAAYVPDSSTPSADHLEEIVFPAEAVGHDYVVTVPTGPHGAPVEHVVRLFGHAAASALSYYPAKPVGAPDSIAPGAVAEFRVADPRDSTGDPSQSLTTGSAQFRERYVFLALPDYPKSYVNIVAFAGTVVRLDGATLDAASATTLLGRAADGMTPQAHEIYREELAAARAGQHELSATEPVGIQVVGYGRFTSYQYPGGLNLNLVSDPPPLPPVPK